MSISETPGLAAERLENIRRILRDRGMARVDELSTELRVSAATVRRDLAELDERGNVRRVHGGAVSVEGRLEEPVFDDKAAIAAREKQNIAAAALRMVKPEDSLFLDGGSTVLALARMLGEMGQLTVVTNSLRVAGMFAGSGPRTILVGGELRQLSQTFVGPLTEPLLDRIRFDTAFMGTIGLSSEGGMTTTDPREAYTKELVMSRARKVVMLADSTKIGKVSFVRFGRFSDVDVLVTDRSASKKDVSMFRKAGIKVVLA